MNRRAYSIGIVLVLCCTGYLAWRHFLVERELATAAFIQFQIDTTQQSYIDLVTNETGLALRLAFLCGYFEHEIRHVHHPVLRRSLERDYRQTLTNAVVVFRKLATNDLGSDPTAWIKAYCPEPDGPAHGSQPIRSDTNSTPAAAGSRR